MTPAGMPPHLLRLKKGAVVMLVKNICIASGLCNGTRLRIEQLLEHSVIAKIMQGQHAGKCFLLCRMYFSPDNDRLPIRISRLQLPIRLSFAMTINKAQGQTFDRIGIMLREPVFAHGQLYVALSRVRAIDCLRVYVRNIMAGFNRQGRLDEQNSNTYTRNVVYRQVLSQPPMGM